MKEERLQLIPHIQGIVKNYYRQLHAKKLDNLGAMDKLLETHNLPKLSQEEAESLNRPTTTSKIEAVIKKLLAHRSPGADGFPGEFYQTIKEGLTPTFLNYSKKSKKREDSQIIFTRPISS